MKETWERIERWFAENAPEFRIRLLPGAFEADIEALEADLSVTLPESFRASLLVHNGQHGLARPLVEEWQLASVADVRREWEVMQEIYDRGAFTDTAVNPIGPVQPVWWLPQWIPFAYNGAGDLLCLDMAPAPGGSVGQIVTFWHTQETRQVLAPDFGEWLATFAADLWAGKYLLQRNRLTRQE